MDDGTMLSNGSSTAWATSTISNLSTAAEGHHHRTHHLENPMIRLFTITASIALLAIAIFTVYSVLMYVDRRRHHGVRGRGLLVWQDRTLSGWSPGRRNSKDHGVSDSDSEQKHFAIPLQWHFQWRFGARGTVNV